ncbi:MAG: ABC transporter ATP-binding protein [Oscillospiraceae bacterium]|nr:ABC transporter ATP-binding protein [Oscillospiraceae bacterium]
MFKLLKYLRKKDCLFAAISVGFIVLQVWLDLLMPDYTANLTQEIASGAPTLGAVWRNGGFMLLCAFGSVASSMICSFFVAQIATRYATTLRAVMFDKVLSFSDKEINAFTTPSLITRTTNDIIQIRMMIVMGLQVFIKAPILAIWAICKMSVTSVEWTFATAIAVAIIAVMVVLLVILCFPRFRVIQKLTDRLNNVTRENVSGVRVVRAFNAEAYQEQKFEDVNDAIVKNHLFTARTMGLMFPVMTMCMSGLTLAIYWIAAILMNDVPAGAEAPMARVEIFGNAAAFMQYAMQVVMAFMSLIMIFIMLPRCLVSAKRINEVLDTVPAIRDGAGEGVKDPAAAPHKIEFRHVSFSYSGGEENTIRDVSFTVEAGQTVAVIGATGSGKTTLVNLLERSYDATEGAIFVDGVNIRHYRENDLRAKISLAPQKAVLFKGNIRSNITYGEDGEADETRLQTALEVSCAAEFVGSLENGAESAVAQGGTNFSGGQKQRLSIARAVYKNAEIMIFDDTFSALDFKTDMLVRRGIRETYAGATVLIVAQRIGTIMNADKILVLDEGRLVGEGTHKELLESCPIYRSIALSQLGKEEL